MGIRLMGIEFEGAWRGQRGIAPFNDASIKHDGSVRNCIDTDTNEYFTHYGELVSPPLRTDELIQWARAYVPHGINNSCGTHIHVSFQGIQDYAACVSRRFFTDLYKELDRLATSLRESDPEFSRSLHRRMSGGGAQYCRRRFVPGSQMFGDYSDSRYAGINYCWGEHGTFEVRVLPGIDKADTAEAAIRTVIRVVEDHLQRNSFRKKFKFRR
jgi:hypothetical protein